MGQDFARLGLGQYELCVLEFPVSTASHSTPEYMTIPFGFKLLFAYAIADATVSSGSVAFRKSTTTIATIALATDGALAVASALAPTEFAYGDTVNALTNNTACTGTIYLVGVRT